MPSYSDYLRGKQRGANVVFQKYNLAKSGRNQVFVFYEGKDDSSFYTNFIEQRISADCEAVPLVCHGKKYVYGIYEMLNGLGELSERHLFFTDKDFDDYIDSEREIPAEIFETEWYSFENYLFGPETLRRFLVECLCVQDRDQIATIIDAYNEQYERMVKIIRPILVLCIEYRLSGYEMYLDNINLKNIASVNNELVVRRNSRRKNEFDKAWNHPSNSGKSHAISLLSSLGVSRILKNDNPKQYFRGKYEKWFFVEFCKKIVGYLERNSVSYKKVVDMHVGNCVQFLGPRILQCEHLEGYLDARIA